MKWHLAIFAIIVILAALALGTMYFVGVNVIDYALGFISGIGLYSVFWHWRYGFWPD